MLEWVGENAVGLVAAGAGIAAAVFGWLAWKSNRKLLSVNLERVADYIGRGPHLWVRLRARRNEVFVGQVVLLPRHGDALRGEVMVGMQLGRIREGDIALVVFPWPAIHTLHASKQDGPIKWVAWYDAEDRAMRQPIPRSWTRQFHNPNPEQ